MHQQIGMLPSQTSECKTFLKRSVHGKVCCSRQVYCVVHCQHIHIEAERNKHK